MPPPTAPQPLAPGSDTGYQDTGYQEAGRRDADYRDADDVGGEEIASADTYGPDDPAYGPPDASWYERRKRERERELEEEEFLAEAAEETPSSRGVFEPLSHRGGAERTSLDLLLDADDETDGNDRDGTGGDFDPLERVKDMYLAAEAVSGEDIDRRFEELLERQRKLIGAYFERERPLVQGGTGARG